MMEVRRLGEEHRAAIAAHLLALDEDGLRCRFMGSCTPRSRAAYASALDLGVVLVSGAFHGGELVGVAEIHPCGGGRAELALSVDVRLRGQGMGTLLLAHALADAQAHGLQEVEARCMPRNGAMRALVAKRSASVRVLDSDEAVAEFALAA